MSRRRRPALQAWLVAVLAVYSGSAFATDLSQLVGPSLRYLVDLSAGANSAQSPDVKALVSAFFHLFLFTLAFLWAKRLAEPYLWPRTRRLRIEEAQARAVLVAFLSLLRMPAKGLRADGRPEVPELSGNLDYDLAALAQEKERGGFFWSWEQILRGLRPHLWRGQLKLIVLVVSRESLRQAKLLTEILRGYAELQAIPLRALVRRGDQDLLVHAGEIPSDSAGWDFEAFDDLADGLMSLFAQLAKAEGFRDHDIMIDITGGQKVTSAVAAAVTFNREIKVQYVQTSSPYRVVSYDLVIERPEPSLA